MEVTITRPIATKITVSKAGAIGTTISKIITKVVQSGVGLQGATGAAGGGVEATYACPATVAVADLVMLVGSNQVDRTDNGSPATCDALGFVISKPSSTQAVVRSSGQAAVFTGLTPAQRYWVGSAGALTATPPNTGVVQQVSKAVTATILHIAIQPRIIL
jgi:hypothetical protein